MLCYSLYTPTPDDSLMCSLKLLGLIKIILEIVEVLIKVLS